MTALADELDGVTWGSGMEFKSRRLRVQLPCETTVVEGEAAVDEAELINCGTTVSDHCYQYRPRALAQRFKGCLSTRSDACCHGRHTNAVAAVLEAYADALLPPEREVALIDAEALPLLRDELKARLAQIEQAIEALDTHKATVAQDAAPGESAGAGPENPADTP